jgi:hypothetical protein
VVELVMIAWFCRLNCCTGVDWPQSLGEGK